MRITTFLFTCLSLFVCEEIAQANPTSRGTVFWGSFIENLPLTYNGQSEFSFFISCDVNTSGVISLPATGYTQNFTATGGQVTEVFLPAGVFYPIGSENIANCGFCVTANNPINLSVEHHRLYYSDASIILPLTELGDQYMVMAHADDFNSGGYSEFAATATEDNTTIDITPSALTFALRPAGVSFSVTLNKGEVYQVQANGDLSGSTIHARQGKKIAVFSGATYAIVHCQATNHLYDEDYPVSSWGNEFVVVPFIPGHADEIRILAEQDGTKVFINCDAPIILNKGQYYDLLASYAIRISSTAPVTVGQFKLGEDCSTTGDPSFLMHKPIAFESHKAIFASMLSAISGNQFTQHYVNIVVRSSLTSYVTVDNNAVPFSQVPLNPGYSYAHVSLVPGSHTLLSDSGFYATVVGVGQYDAYSYLAGYDDVHYTNSSLDIEHSDTLCTNSATAFTVNSGAGISGWYWSFGDGGSSTQQNPTHNYPSAGTYNVMLTTTDAGNCPSFSQQNVTIENCFYDSDCELFVPDAFSPNHDGVNDFALVYGACIKEMEFTIYDRWGEIVFQSNDMTQGWDGSYKGKALDNAVFAWVLKATLTSGSQVAKKGNITLIR